MPNQPKAAANNPDGAMENDPRAAEIGPTDAEVEAWAQQERDRREAWLRGPAQAQKSDWATPSAAGVWPTAAWRVYSAPACRACRSARTACT